MALISLMISQCSCFIMYKIFDTHAHYTDIKYDGDREKLFENIKLLGVTDTTLVSASLSESEKTRDLYIKCKDNENFPNMYFTIGEHPDEIITDHPESEIGIDHLNKLEKFTSGAVAIGEIGLDYYGKEDLDPIYKKNQQEWFIAELNLAKKLNLPVVIHSRDACKDTMDIMKEYGKDLRGVIHCFAYEKDVALEYINMGYFIGVGGIITFKNARKLVEIVESIPLEYIVTETDSPYLAPVPHRGERNDSSNIKYVIEKIADIKKIDVDKCADIVYENAKRLYNIK